MIKIITSTQLRKLFEENQRKGQEIFPEMIKRLIMTTINQTGFIRIPSQDAVWSPGPDGVLENITTENRYIPLGNSVLEMGINSEYIKKADEDFEKRTHVDTNFDRCDYSFIFCTPFVWAGKKENGLLQWTTSKNDLKIWKNVKIIDGIVLEDWLNQNLNVLLWLLYEFNESQKLLKIKTFNQKYAEVEKLTEPKFNKNIMICGNDTKIEVLKNKLGNSGYCIVFSETNFEQSLYFVLGAISSFEDTLLQKVIIVEDMEAFEYVEQNSHGLIVLIAYQGEYPKNPDKNTYILPTSNSTYAADIKLDPIFMADYIKSLESLGIDGGVCYELAHKTNRSISCLKRALATSQLIKQPAWAKDDKKDEIIPIALLSEIDYNSVADMEVVEELSGVKFDEYIECLERWAKKDDSPIFKFSNLYIIYSKEESLKILDLKYDSVKVKKLEIILQKIFTTKAEVQPIKGNRPKNKYSTNMVNGILDSFAILSNDEVSQTHYDNFVENIFKSIRDDIDMLNLVVEKLPLLSEVSANSVIQYIEDCLDKVDKTFDELVKLSYGVIIIKWDNLLYILWALEHSVGRKEYSEHSLIALLKLYYKKYETDNVKQINEVVAVLFSPHASRYTEANSFKKIEIAMELSKNLSSEQMELAEKLFIKMRVAELNWYPVPAHPKWKEYEKGKGIPPQEIVQVDERATDWLLENSIDKVELLKRLLSPSIHLYSEDYVKKLLTKIETNILTKVDSEQLRRINVQLSSTIESLERQCNNANEFENLNGLISLLKNLHYNTISKDLFERHRYLFEKPQFDVYYDEYGQAEKVKNAVTELLENYGMAIRDRIIDITSDENGIVWEVLYEESTSKIDDIKKFIVKNKVTAIIFYLHKMSFVGEIRDIIMSIDNTDLLEQICKKMPLTKETIEALDNSDFEEIFWINQSLFDVPVDIYDIVYDKALRFAPFNLVRHLVYGIKNELDYEKSLTVLNAVIKKVNTVEYASDDDYRQNGMYYFTELIDELDKKFYTDDLAICEFKLLALYMSERDNYPRGIQEFFWRNPIKFVDFYVSIFGKDNATKFKKDSLANKILVDGRYGIGDISAIPLEYLINDPTELKKWVDIVFKLLLDKNHEIIIDFTRMIVDILAHCPETVGQTIWPTKEIAKLIECCYEHLMKTIADDEKYREQFDKIPLKNRLASRMYFAKSNCRGVRTVNRGTHEFELGKKYLEYSMYYKTSCPVTSLMLEYLSDSSNRDGNHDRKSAILGDRF